ncbi:MAG: CapA family protein [Lachnospiraceae bacterium]|nr:CapA family protein [Lachnospiraceae bacterium]
MKKKICLMLSLGLLLQGCGQAPAAQSDPRDIVQIPSEEMTGALEASMMESESVPNGDGLGATGSTEMPAENGFAESKVLDSMEKSADDAFAESQIWEPEIREITLAFAGDINFDDHWCNMVYYHSHAEALSDVIDEDYLECMRDADLFWINNEFTYSDRGAPLEGKMYTFRAAPENVGLLAEMGADIVGLANNHVYDYGEDALLDTMETLQNAGILYVGAGHDLAEAMSPVYFDLDGFTVAYVAASRAEKFKMTPQATETKAGILRCYDNTLFLEEIEEAAAHADYVIALPHWGTEYSTVLEEAQTQGAKAYIDAGADAVIGAHSHCLQGLELYEDKPVIYSLGNFWFNEKTLDTMMVVLHVTYETDNRVLVTDYADQEQNRHDIASAPRILSVETEIVPGTQAGYITTMADTTEERRRIFDYLEGISEGVRIDDEGMLR